jgi:hypothetical protein
MSIKISTVGRNAEADAMARQHDNGYWRIYSGTRPANPQTAITGTLLAEGRFSATSAAAASTGVLTWSTVADAGANASGAATHFRTWKSDGTTALIDGDVSDSAGAGDLKLVQTGNTNIVADQPVSISSWTYTVPE